tara:strand:+ start:2502 stop:3137 length:636 start_codon:yes stop_codon:yes gene_type:complete
MALVVLVSVFTGFLVIANVIATKLLFINGWVLPAGILAYPLTFLISDTIAEIYGRKITSRIIWLGFTVSVLIVFVVYIAQIFPAAPFWENQEAFDTILGSVPRIVLASMIAYLISQHHDVVAFHMWKNFTGGKHLWLRNNASTLVSQGIDTVLFVCIAFAGTVEGSVLVNMVITQYIFKILISLADTPLVYALVSLIRNRKWVDLPHTPKV